MGSDGALGWELGVSAGLGYAFSERTAARSMPGFATSDRGAAALTETVEVGRVEKDLVWATGFTAELATTGDEVAAWLFGATLVPLLGNRRHDPGHEKIGISSTTRWALSAGLETRVGLATETETRDGRGLFAILPAIDYTLVGITEL